MSLVKICGLRTPETLEAALAAGADMVGFVRFARSPRHVDLELGRALSREAAGRARRVLLLVDPTDGELDETIRAIEPDLVQLHGGESPERVAAIRSATGRPVMKALPIGERADLARIDAYRDAADRILLDAKPPKDAALPGGNGIAFDWSLLGDLPGRAGSATPLCAALGMTAATRPRPDLMLSGGLTPETVGEAIRISGLAAVDVSSGVESRPGEKDTAKIAAFVRAARAAFAA
ncbi:phosphoribosylanthranilate isomerase [Enterovirga rhinocerotis]|uniref:N-(5'-phosphoribosyl)anthranilate isomerase n=1 Tax=Enterovirga rhinocerotis TaxID=1339210 RepID=A0A4R7BRV7_9HYPH|nr:phosphoribosylanthranilate isomerase [Enterovirga rhinocerotis]TDR87195.1 phosphoribosylanthranilate isomerase [Enterovirga rhinocerotis]